jgi:hypothetical protein
MRQRAAQAAGDERGAAVEGDHCERVTGQQPGEPGEQLAVPGVPCRADVQVEHVPFGVVVGVVEDQRPDVNVHGFHRLDPFESRAR